MGSEITDFVERSSRTDLVFVYFQRQFYFSLKKMMSDELAETKRQSFLL